MQPKARQHVEARDALQSPSDEDGAGFVLRVTEGSHESVERIPPSSGDHLLHARIKELGLSESADLLLKGEELVVKTTRHRWPLP